MSRWHVRFSAIDRLPGKLDLVPTYPPRHWGDHFDPVSVGWAVFAGGSQRALCAALVRSQATLSRLGSISFFIAYATWRNSSAQVSARSFGRYPLSTIPLNETGLLPCAMQRTL